MVNRILPQPALSGVVMVVWLLLLNSFTFGGLLLAMALGVGVPLVTNRFRPQGPKLKWGPPVVGYLAVVVYDIVIANFEVAYTIIVRRNADLRSRWLVVPLELRSAEAITTLAAAITLTPGTVSANVSADGRTLLVHALDAPDADKAVSRIKQRYEARLLRIFP